MKIRDIAFCTAVALLGAGVVIALFTPVVLGGNER